jgi:hypothetical protein
MEEPGVLDVPPVKIFPWDPRAYEALPTGASRPLVLSSPKGGLTCFHRFMHPPYIECGGG